MRLLKRVRARFTSIVPRKDGQALVELALVLVLVSVASIVALTMLGDTLQ